jgi:DNA-binding NarL/FixJ family response regulator
VAKSFRYQPSLPRVTGITDTGLLLSANGSNLNLCTNENLTVQTGLNSTWENRNIQPSYIIADLTAATSDDTVSKALKRVRENYPKAPVLAATSLNRFSEAHLLYPDKVIATTSISDAIEQAQNLRRIRETIPSHEELTLLMYADGKTRIDIANEMYISVDSIKRYTINLFRFLRVSAQAEAVHAGFSNGYLAAPPPATDYPASWPLSEAETLVTYALGTTGNHNAAADLINVSPHAFKSHTRAIRKRVGWRPTRAIQQMWISGAIGPAKQTVNANKQ